MIITIANQEFQVEYRDVLAGIDLEDDKFFTFDSETTGLHIRADKPFLFAICTGHTVYIFPPTVENLETMVSLSHQVRRAYAHNASFDCHMIANAGVNPLKIKNIGDSMCLARLSFEAISTRDGGDSLALKKIAKKYIDSTADRFESDVKKWLSEKRRMDKKVLTAMLKPLGWSASKLEKEGPTYPTEVAQIYYEWQQAYPEPTYQDVPLDIMIPYLAVDVILTRLLVLKAFPVVVHRKQQEVMEREFKVLPVVWKMERAGIKVDRAYLLDCQQKLRSYIGKLYVELQETTGMEFSVGQHSVIRDMYTEILGEAPESTDKKFLKKMESKGDRAATLITRIRRFEKWLATYIDRILEVSEYDGRFYTQMNQFNPVSGRFSGDLQQMPKDPIYTEEGYEYEKTHPGHKVPKEYILYHPRRAFVPSGNGLNYLFFQDFSQVELRITANYTLLFGGDVNMLRAYCPYRCTHYATGETYSLETDLERRRWSELKPDGESAWLTEESKPWIPTDVHMATTLKALVAMGFNPDEMSEDDLQWWRKKGKTFNFGRNYGMGDTHAAETLEIELEQAKALNKGYSDAFPLVVTYQQAVIDTMRDQGYCQHALGRRYYVANSYKHYKVANYMVQGLCADDLKAKMILIDDFLVKNNCKSRLLLCIHDELVFEIHEDEQWIVPETVAVMEETHFSKVPIVADVEYTSTSWDAKKKWVQA